MIGIQLKKLILIVLIIEILNKRRLKMKNNEIDLTWIHIFLFCIMLGCCTETKPINYEDKLDNICQELSLIHEEIKGSK